jgi:hypothetical protein
MTKFVEYSIQLFCVRDRQLVEAKLSLASSKHLQSFEQHWQPILLNTMSEDRYWDWLRKKQTYGSRPGAQSYAIECEEMTQGLMLIETLRHRSWFKPRQRIVYVHSVATAPWNRSSIQEPPKYRLVGSALLEFAQYRSIELGYQGLVGLHALPEAEEFYRRLGMIECGCDPNKEGLMYFEWFGQQASSSNELEEAVNWEDEPDTTEWLESGEVDNEF